MYFLLQDIRTTTKCNRPAENQIDITMDSSGHVRIPPFVAGSLMRFPTAVLAEASPHTQRESTNPRGRAGEERGQRARWEKSKMDVRARKRRDAETRNAIRGVESQKAIVIISPG